MYVENQVGIRLIRTTRIVFDIARDHYFFEVPLAANHVVGQIGGIRLVDQIYLQARIRPRAEFHIAHLLFFFFFFVEI